MIKKSLIRLDETISGHVQKKWNCPSCGKKRFVRFYNFKSLEYLPEQFGRCDRSENCTYYLSPYSDETYRPGKGERRADFIQAPKKINYVDKDILHRTLTRYDENNFVQFLISRVGTERAIETVFKYFVGTAKNNGTIFWQIDSFMQIRTAQKIFYKTDGHRDKANPPSKIKPYLVENDYLPCLFGEHLLFHSDANDLIAIVESEKTAILASTYMPDVNGRKIIWLAASGANGLTNEKIQPLRGRDIWLVPDFSFHARATWGLFPMRKKYVDKEVGGVVKQILVPHPDGEIVEYESAADRLRKIGCSVYFFDPYPNIDDGSDIGDTFVQTVAGPEIKMPSFSELLIDDKPDEIKAVNESFVQSDSKIPPGRHSFKLAELSPGNFDVRTVNVQAGKLIEDKFMKNKLFLRLVNTFAIEGGTLTVE